MDHAYALAFALANRGLCFFVGAGFSKHLTKGKMPGWFEMLEKACEKLRDPRKAKKQLTEMSATLPLEDCAQILELAFSREEKDLRQAIAEIVSAYQIDETAAETVKRFLADFNGVSIITTNYDTLIEDQVLPDRCNSNYRGKPISRGHGKLDVVHVHGCVKNPAGMVITTTDYFKFINSSDYFSKKVFTLINESPTLIMGYSLADPNLKAILNALRSNPMGGINRGNLFYITSEALQPYVRDYYEAAYGITTIDSKSIDECLCEILGKMTEAKKRIANAETDLRGVLSGKKVWKDEFLRLRESLFHILATANTLGVDVHSPESIRMLGKVLEAKVNFSHESGAWEQYSHLADWLVYIGSIMDLQKTSLENPYLNAVKHSMKTMSKEYVFGYSWDACKIWKANWSSLTFANRLLVKKYINREFEDADALGIVNQKEW